MPKPDDDYELLDVGVRRKLERFGPLTIDRPAPGADAFRLAPDRWAEATLRFDPGAGWSGPAWEPEPWSVSIHGLTMELRPTASGGLGLYPEHAANLDWLSDQVARRVATGATGVTEPPQVLNLFAHTGLATLALARAGAAVAHVDGARSAVAWARRNADLTGFRDRPVRWLVDDAVAFVAREARRGRRYAGFVIDPPAFGHAGGREWRLDDSLPGLLATCRAIAAPDAFVLLTAHSGSFDGNGLASMLDAAFTGVAAAEEVVRVEVAATSGALLPLGWAVRSGA